MSLFYDPYNKRPQIWTYFFFVLLTAGLLLAIYLYGNKKAESQAVDAQRNAGFEGALE
jgi:hypothetical protein